VRITVEERALREVRRGHPWIFREALRSTPQGKGGPKTGDFVELFDPAGAQVGVGLYDAASPIAVRVYGVGAVPPLDAKGLAKLVETAFARRDGWFDHARTNAYRLCNGEGDRVPGVVIDRYAAVAVARLDGDAITTRWRELAPRIGGALSSRGVTGLYLRRRSDDDGEKAEHVFGATVDGAFDVLEESMVLEVDVLRGQKTGAFLDQRENRARIRALAKGRPRVLNLFSYSGGFSIAAALGGATHVVSVDIAQAAHATAQRIFEKNGVDPRAHRFVTADATTFVAELGRRGERFDLVISDPPSFAPNAKSKPRALSAYAKLHRAAAALVAPGGVFCAASCSSHVSMEDFMGTLDDFALGRSDLVVRAAFGPPADHPTSAAFAEGRYLKMVVLS
jgi:23S rRNA (cytosine1962-C5)-methyltransferase